MSILFDRGPIGGAWCGQTPVNVGKTLQIFFICIIIIQFWREI